MIKEHFKVLQQHELTLSNGCKVSYIDEGNGAECILFIHGLATFAKSWHKNIEGLKDKFRCIAIDLPGNGYSDKGDYAYGVHFYAACVYDFMQLLKLKKVILCGHSMGGQIAMTLLLNAPDAAEKLVLCAPAGFEQFNAFEKSMYRSAIGLADFFSTDESNLRKSIHSSFFQNAHQADGIIEDLVAILRHYPSSKYKKMLDACVQSMMDEPVYNNLHKIKQATLVIYGDRDALIPNKLIHPVSTQQMALTAIKKMPHAQLEMIPRCGHFVQWEQAQIVNTLIANFLHH
jgi:pimeloyl-ACP methyl ester carboxylesterase